MMLSSDWATVGRHGTGACVVSCAVSTVVTLYLLRATVTVVLMRFAQLDWPPSPSEGEELIAETILAMRRFPERLVEGSAIARADSRAWCA